MEMMDVVNEDDEVVGTASKQEIYEKLLPHRIAHILIFNDRGEMAIQKSSVHKKYCPLHWGTAVGGHVQAGESVEQAALREFKEEIGVQVPVEFAFRDWFTGPRGIRKLLTTFRAHYDGPFAVNPFEVEKVEFFSLEKIGQMILAGEKFHPELLFLLKRHFNFEQ